MNYVETGGFSGELFAVSDNSGNIVAWTSILGINNNAAIRDPNNAYIDPREIYNPNDINVPLGWNGKKGNNITIQQVGTGNDLIFNAGGSGFSITNLWGAIDITGSTTTTTTDDTTDKDGGDDEGNCENSEDCDAVFASWYRNFSLWNGWLAARQKFRETGQIWVPTFSIWGTDPYTGGEGYVLDVELFATDFFKELFGADYEDAVEDMYYKNIEEYEHKWLEDCEKMRNMNCENIPDACNNRY